MSPSSSTPTKTTKDATTGIEAIRNNLDQLNKDLAKQSPREILEWLQEQNLPRVVRFTSFGLSGMVLTHLMHELEFSVPTVFIDTLHHFQETLDLKDIVTSRYNTDVRVYKTNEVADAEEFKAQHGEMWKSNEEEYQHIVKIEPTMRAFRELDVAVWITGRRRSQGNDRDTLQVLEFDEEDRLKVNPIAWLSFNDVQSYVKGNNVPYNALLDRGYKSIGDVHSTVPVAADAPERSGRWKGSVKSECGLHNRPAHIQRKMEERAKLRRLSQASTRPISRQLSLDSLGNSLEMEEIFTILSFTTPSRVSVPCA